MAWSPFSSADGIKIRFDMWVYPQSSVQHLIFSFRRNNSYLEHREYWLYPWWLAVDGFATLVEAKSNLGPNNVIEFWHWMKCFILTFESYQAFLSVMTVHEKSWGSRSEILDWSCLYIHPGNPKLIILFRTLYESKGLEFDDVSAVSLPSCSHLIDASSKFKVLLYKFFEDSTVDLSKWRVVLNLLGDGSNLDIPAPCFEESRHAGVCSEVGRTSTILNWAN